jgi:hypothetical protein
MVKKRDRRKVATVIGEEAVAVEVSVPSPPVTPLTYRPVTIAVRRASTEADRTGDVDGRGSGMRCPGCGSVNVERLQTYWESLPAESPLRTTRAQPPEAESQYLWAAALAALGLVALGSGAILAGLLALVGGALWGVVSYRKVEDARARRAVWARQVYCLACTEVFLPEEAGVL